MLKVAFAGFRHSHIIDLYAEIKNHPQLEVVGAFEEYAPSRMEAEARDVVFNYESLEALLNDPQVDIVATGDCFGNRGSVAIKALQAGKHVLTDKPLCTRLAELSEIRRLAAEKKLAVGILLNLPDLPNFVTAQEAIQEDMLGKINNIVFEGQHPLLYGSRPDWYYEPELHGGVINDIAIHGIDLARLLTCSDLEEVIGARCWNFYAKEGPSLKDSAQFLLKTTSGAGIIGDVSYAAPNTQGFSHSAYWHFRIWGEKGMMDFGVNLPHVTVYLNGEKQPRLLPQSETRRSYLTDFLAAVETPALTAGFNARMLASTEQTLMVQAKADSCC